MTNPTLASLEKRRSQYVLGTDAPLAPAEIDALIRQAIRLAPSSFNSQSSRAVILFGDESRKMWDIARAALQAIVPADGFEATSTKLDSFAAGVGTVLFFEDQDVVAKLQADFALYADNFPVWSEQASGMAQLAVWTALADAGIGASLQHYNPLIDADVARTWNLPASWKLRAQMPFGAHKAGFGDKAFMDDADRFKTFG